MRASIRTLSTYATLLAGAVLLGACETSITPPPDSPPATPDAIRVIGGVTWTRTDLPFAPAAINASGVIVGTSGTQAVRWRNGVIDTLPHRAELPGPYVAVDVTPNGLVLGAANGHVLYWFQDGIQPVDVTSGSSYAGYLSPVAMNDGLTIVALSYNYYVPTTVRWTYPGAWIDIGGGHGISGFDGTVVTSMNAAGQATGYRSLYFKGVDVPIKWSRTNNMWAQMSAPLDPNNQPSGRGVSIDPSGNIFGFTVAGPTMWNVNGTITNVAGLPGSASLRSDAGRFVGVGMNNGAQQLFTSLNGAVTWLSSPDASAPTAVDVNNCGAIIGRRGTTPATGSYWRRTGIAIFGTCDTSPVLQPVSTMQ